MVVIILLYFVFLPDPITLLYSIFMNFQELSKRYSTVAFFASPSAIRGTYQIRLSGGAMPCKVGNYSNATSSSVPSRLSDLLASRRKLRLRPSMSLSRQNIGYRQLFAIHGLLFVRYRSPDNRYSADFLGFY